MYKKGQSGNPKGRPKGSKNNERTVLANRISLFLSCNFDKIMNDFQQLEPVERVKAYTSLIQYVLPKMQAVDVNGQIQAEYQEIKALITNAPETAITAIAQKMLSIKSNNQENEI